MAVHAVVCDERQRCVATGLGGDRDNNKLVNHRGQQGGLLDLQNEVAMAHNNWSVWHATAGNVETKRTAGQTWLRPPPYL